MTNHYDEMKVSPDPSQAEELRQRLHARMANISTDDHRGRSALDLDSDGHPDEWIVPPLELSPPDTSTTHQRTHRRRALVAAAAVVVAIAAAGIATRIEDPSGVATTASTPTTASGVATTAPTPTTASSIGSNGGAPSNEGCPFTAEEVSDAIGETVTGPESSTLCFFGQTFPSVSFEYLPASACRQENLRKEGFSDSDAVDGFGVDAYAVRYSLGLMFIVCDGTQPFELVVDGVDGDDVAVAVALAMLVRNG